MCRTMSTALVVGSPVNIGTNKSTYQLLSDEQKARFNAIAPADNRNAAAKDQHDLTKLCDEKTSGATDLPIDRIAPSHPFRNDRFPIAAITTATGTDRLGDVAEADDCAVANRTDLNRRHRCACSGSNCQLTTRPRPRTDKRSLRRDARRLDSFQNIRHGGVTLLVAP
jgi:hypothetical protein